MSREAHEIINEALRLTGDIALHAKLAESANLQAAKPADPTIKESLTVARPSVVPMPEPAWWLNDTEVYETKQRDSENNVIIGQVPLYTEDQLTTLRTQLAGALAESGEMREALEFYADERRYEGANQRLLVKDKFTPDNMPYRMDVTRDGGELARAAIASHTTTQESATYEAAQGERPTPE